MQALFPSKIIKDTVFYLLFSLIQTLMVKLASNMTWTIKNDREDLEKLHRTFESEDLDEQGLTCG